ncbi:MAG: transposase [Planctomycetota bacterium]|jgi:REP element-mobilizing transposase RayT
MSNPKPRREGRQFWHAMARGVRQTPIFLTDENRLKFLRLLEHSLEKTSVSLHSFVLMKNHYHMMAEATRERLGQCIQLLNSLYARRLNEQIRSSGHLFQGRFRAYPSKSPAWTIQRVTYMHLNPVEGGLVKDPFEYRWSSLGAFVGGTCEIETIDPSKLLRPLGKTISEQAKEYENIIRQSVDNCLRGREYAEQAFRNRPKLNNVGMEEVRLQIDEVMTLHGSVQHVLQQAPVGYGKQRGLETLLTSHLSKAWNLAPADIVALVLDCSVGHVQNKRLQALELVASDNRLQELILRIEKIFGDCLTPSSGPRGIITLASDLKSKKKDEPGV